MSQLGRQTLTFNVVYTSVKRGSSPFQEKSFTCKFGHERTTHSKTAPFLHYESMENVITGVNQKVPPVLSTETLLHIWLSTEYYGFRPSSTAADMVSYHALDPTEPRKRKQIGFLLAPIVKEVSNFVSYILVSFLLQRLT